MDLVPEDGRIEWVEGSLNDIDDLEPLAQKCDILIHAAAALSMKQGELKRLKKINGAGTGHMVNLALLAGIKRLVYVSSVAALGREKEGLIREEDHFEEAPIVSDYARSKYEGDKEAYRGIAEGLSVNIIRPSLILGAGHWEEGSDAILHKIAKGMPYYPVGGTGAVDVRDVARMTIELAIAQEDGLDVICSGHNVSWKDLNGRLAEAIGVTPPEKPLSRWLEGVIWRIERLRSFFGKNSIITKSSLERAGNTYFYDNSLGVKLFDFAYTPLETTTKDVGVAYRKYTSTGAKSRLPLT